MPFVIGWIIAMIANPLVHFFEQKIRIRRKAGSAIVLIAVLAGVILIGYFVIARLVTEAAGFVASLPSIWQDIEKELNEVMGSLEALYDRFPSALKENLTQIGDNLGSYISSAINGLREPTVNAVGNIARNIPSVIVSTIMCLLSSYFFVAERENVYAFFRRHVPESIRKKFRIMSSGLTGAVGGYFVAQFRIEIVIYFVLFIGLLILQVEYSFLIAFLIAVLDFFPVFGAGAVLWPWALMEVLAGNSPDGTGTPDHLGSGAAVKADHPAQICRGLHRRTRHSHPVPSVYRLPHRKCGGYDSGRSGGHRDTEDV